MGYYKKLFTRISIVVVSNSETFPFLNVGCIIFGMMFLMVFHQIWVISIAGVSRFSEYLKIYLNAYYCYSVFGCTTHIHFNHYWWSELHFWISVRQSLAAIFWVFINWFSVISTVVSMMTGLGTTLEWIFSYFWFKIIFPSISDYKKYNHLVRYSIAFEKLKSLMCQYVVSK